MQDPPLNPRDAALWRVGRNFVNFQRWEAALKALIPLLSVSGTPGAVVERLKSQAIALKRTPLGELASLFHSQAVQEAAPVGGDDAAPALVSITFRIDADAQFRKDYRAELLSLVEQRNRLVHQDLAKVDFDCVDECERLSRELDEQNLRICHQLVFLKEVSSLFVTGYQELIKVFESDELRS